MSLVAFWNRATHEVEIHAEEAVADVSKGFDKLIVVTGESKQEAFTGLRSALLRFGADMLKIEQHIVHFVHEGKRVESTTIAEGTLPEAPEDKPEPEVAQEPVQESEPETPPVEQVETKQAATEEQPPAA